MFRFCLFKVGQFLIKILPPELCYSIAGFVSDLHYCFFLKDRRAVENNLRVILPYCENISKEAREVFRNFGRYLVEFFQMERMLDDRYINEKIKIQNIEKIQKVLDRGKGGIILSAHIGNWEMGAALLGMLGYPLNVVAMPHSNKRLNDLFNRQREQKGIKVIPTNMSLRKCIASLRKNELVAMVAERDFSSKNGKILNFLGQKTSIPRGAAVFAEKTGAAIIPLFLIREGYDNFIAFVKDPIFPLSDKGEKKSVLNLIKEYIGVIEEQIRSYPTQWIMFREFWIK